MKKNKALFLEGLLVLVLAGLVLCMRSAGAAERIEKEPVKIAEAGIHAPNAVTLQEKEEVMTSAEVDEKNMMLVEDDSAVENKTPEKEAETAVEEAEENSGLMNGCYRLKEDETEVTEQEAKLKEAIVNAGANLETLPETLEAAGNALTLYRENGKFGFYYDKEKAEVSVGENAELPALNVRCKTDKGTGADKSWGNISFYNFTDKKNASEWMSMELLGFLNYAGAADIEEFKNIGYPEELESNTVHPSVAKVEGRPMVIPFTSKFYKEFWSGVPSVGIRNLGANGIPALWMEVHDNQDEKTQSWEEWYLISTENGYMEIEVSADGKNDEVMENIRQILSSVLMEGVDWEKEDAVRLLEETSENLTLHLGETVEEAEENVTLNAGLEAIPEVIPFNEVPEK